MLPLIGEQLCLGDGGQTAEVLERAERVGIETYAGKTGTPEAIVRKDSSQEPGQPFQLECFQLGATISIPARIRHVSHLSSNPSYPRSAQPQIASFCALRSPQAASLWPRLRRRAARSAFPRGAWERGSLLDLVAEQQLLVADVQ